MEKLLGEPITDQILSEVTFVHRANLRNDGRVTETDYLLFKLLQLQKVDVAVLEKLVDRYHALDVDNSGTLEIGLEVPSAAQVEELRRRAAAEVAEGTVEEERPLRVLWNEAQQQRRGADLGSASALGGGAVVENAARAPEHGQHRHRARMPFVYLLVEIKGELHDLCVCYTSQLDYSMNCELKSDNTH